MYSSDFCKVRLFRHGAVVAYESPGYSNAGSSTSAAVSVRYYQSDTNYPSDGLGCAFPDIGTHAISRSVDITWEDYSWGMYKYSGSITVTVNSAQRPVQSMDDGWLIHLYDACCSAHQHLETAECHEGVFGNDAQMYFYPASGDKKYQNSKIRRINENLVYLRPDGAPTTTVSGYSNTVGYFILHTLNGRIEEQWL